MLARTWRLAVLAAVVCLPGAAFGQAHVPDAEKADALALSRRIDGHLSKRWKEFGVTPAPPAETGTLYRRLHLDLVGTIPDLTLARDNIEGDTADERWEKVERLLAHDRYLKHFANVWRTLILGNPSSDQARFLAPAFENWIRQQLAKNASLDQLVRDILTAAQPNPNMRNFTGRPDMNTANPAAFYFINENKPENLAAATTRAFLGVKLECAQCHNHPFADWKRDQFWEFAAFFGGSVPIAPVEGAVPALPPQGRTAGREIRIPDTNRVVRAKYLTGDEPKWETGSDARKVLSDWITAPKNPYFARAMADHVWTYLMGVSLLEPILEPSDDNLVTHPELLDELASQLAAHRFDPKFLIRAIVHSEAYQRASTGGTKGNKEDYQLFVRMPIRPLSPEQLFDAVAEATNFQPTEPTNVQQQPFGPMANTPRAQFLAKFANQDRRHEPQTSILQALYMMNGRLLNDRISAINGDLQVLAREGRPMDKKVETLYLMVLSRLPRPDETARLVPYLDRGGATNDPVQAIADVYWALLNSAEFMLNH